MPKTGPSSSISIAPYDKWDTFPAKTKKDGSPGMTLLEHALLASYVAEALFLYALNPSQRRLILPDFLSIVFNHDTGKPCPGFIKRLLSRWSLFSQQLPALFQSVVEFQEWHTKVGQAALSVCGFNRGRLRIVGKHHGYSDFEYAQPNDPLYGGPAWQQLRERFFQEGVKLFGSVRDTPVSHFQENATAALLSISDWIASNEEFFPPDFFTPGVDPRNQVDKIKHRAKEIVDEMGWRDHPIPKSNLAFHDIFPFPPNPMQKIIGKAIKNGGVYIIESSTGSGKTEAALFGYYNLVQKRGFESFGLYDGLPTRLTSNRMHRRLKEFFESAWMNGKNPHLIHGESWLTNTEKSLKLEPNNPWFEPNRRALLEPFGVGTADQAILSTLHSYYHFIRQFALIGKFVIFDEVHSYGVHTSTLLSNLIKELRELDCVVVILSATLTAEAKARLLGCDLENIPQPCKEQAYPLLTWLAGKRSKIPRTMSLGKQESRKVGIKHIHNRADALSDAVDECAKGTNIIWIENTVNDAIDTYVQLRNIMIKKGISKPCGLLHSNFLRNRRAAIEEEWMGMLSKEEDLAKENRCRPFGSILVSTQIVEQSVDIDCDLLVTNLAPSDFLFQRIGRLFRHLRTKRPDHRKKPEVWLILPDEQLTEDEKSFSDACGKSGLIYDLYTMWRTYRAWRKKSVVSIPKELRKIVERTYREPAKNDLCWIKKLGFGVMRKKSLHAREALMSTATHERFEEELFATDDVDDETPRDTGALTRRQTVPTVQLVLCKRVSMLGNGKNQMMLELRSGKTVMVFRGQRLNREDAREILLNTVRVVMNKKLRQATPTPADNLLDEVVYGYPRVAEERMEEIWCPRNGSTGYFYTDELGAHRRGL
jgi:CRISPR-associated endonuclease/helicase Cas3